MRRLGALLSTLGFSLALLLVTTAPLDQTASAQEAETSAFDADAPITSLRKANPRTDAQLIDLATALMEARAETKISHSTYQKGVKFFRVNHPQFYGNFFGHPYYATFDSEYMYMSRLRTLAKAKADPLSELPGLFSCHPRWYDPAFGGRCEYQFATFQFLLLPDGSLPAIASTPSSRNPKPIYLGNNCKAKVSPATYDRQCNLLYEWPNRDDEVRAMRASENLGEASPVSPEIARPVKPIQAFDRSIDLPDDVHTSMRKTAFSLWQTEKVLRFRKLIEQKYSGSNLSAQMRDEMASHLAKTFSLNGRAGDHPQGQGFSRSNPGSSNRPASGASGLNRIPKRIDISDLKVPESPRSTLSETGAPNLDPPERSTPNRPDISPPTSERRPANRGGNAGEPDLPTQEPPRSKQPEPPKDPSGN